jgi:hypothetical protein
LLILFLGCEPWFPHKISLQVINPKSPSQKRSIDNFEVWSDTMLCYTLWSRCCWPHTHTAMQWQTLKSAVENLKRLSLKTRLQQYTVYLFEQNIYHFFP